jgi:thiazole/oxazole-forming peptide maturase SagD family component
MPSADPRWLLGLTRDGLVAVGPAATVEVEVEATHEERLAMLGELVDGEVGPEMLAHAAQSDPGEAAELIERLVDAGFLGTSPVRLTRPEGSTLSDAVLALERDEEPSRRHIWTSDELLVLPHDAAPDLTRRALRAFIAAMPDDLRLRAYAYLATRLEPTVWGDAPDPEQAAAALDLTASLSPDAVHVIELGNGGATTLDPAKLGRIGAGESHRLGTIPIEWLKPIGNGTFVGVARHAVPNLRWPGRKAGRIGRGLADDAAQAALIARAEAAERYGAGDAGAHRLVRAPLGDLEGAVPPSSIFRPNARQALALSWPRDGEIEPLWVEGSTPAGRRRWLPAQTVFNPFIDPEPAHSIPIPCSSSGVAAHTDRTEAIERAAAELAEREAFMWTWVQGISRERIDPDTLPAHSRERHERMVRDGGKVHVVNLTLDTLPVIMVLLAHDDWVVVGTAAHPDPSTAARKAVTDVASLDVDAARGLPWERGSVAAVQVQSPRDHLRFHHDAKMLDYDRFLFDSPVQIALDEIEPAQGSALDAVSRIAEPVIVDLTSPATQPFTVVRAIVPGMVPIGFGYDREPLGMGRLARPIKTADGRELGKHLDLSKAGPITPHPFP